MKVHVLRRMSYGTSGQLKSGPTENSLTKIVCRREPCHWPSQSGRPSILISDDLPQIGRRARLGPSSWRTRECNTLSRETLTSGTGTTRSWKSRWPTVIRTSCPRGTGRPPSTDCTTVSIHPTTTGLILSRRTATTAADRKRRKRMSEWVRVLRGGVPNCSTPSPQYKIKIRIWFIKCIKTIKTS